MKNKLFFAVSILIMTSFLFPQPIKLKLLDEKVPKRLNEMVASEIDNLIQLVNSKIKDEESRILVYSELALGTPYVFGCLGEGINGKYDKDPLMDFARYDCMTFCEEMLALAISDSYEETFNNLQKIRYKNGHISFKTRNHYTMADWLPENNWVLNDATKEIGSSLCKNLRRTINRHRLLASNKCYEFDGVTGPTEYTIEYIPKEKLTEIKVRLRGGEIFAVIQNRAGIFAAHMGLIAVDNNYDIIFRHASSADTAMKVVDMKYENYVKSLLDRDRILGMVFMRIKQ